MASVTITGPVLDSTGAPATGLFVVQLTAAFQDDGGGYVSRTPYIVQVAGGELRLADGTSPWTQIVPPAGQAIKVFERLQPSGDSAASGTRVVQRARILQVPGDEPTAKYGELEDLAPDPSTDYTIPPYVQQVFDNYQSTIAERTAAQTARTQAQTAAASASAARDTVVALEGEFYTTDRLLTELGNESALHEGVVDIVSDIIPPGAYYPINIGTALDAARPLTSSPVEWTFTAASGLYPAHIQSGDRYVRVAPAPLPWTPSQLSGLQGQYEFTGVAGADGVLLDANSPVGWQDSSINARHMTVTTNSFVTGKPIKQNTGFGTAGAVSFPGTVSPTSHSSMRFSPISIVPTLALMTAGAIQIAPNLASTDQTLISFNGSNTGAYSLSITADNSKLQIADGGGTVIAQTASGTWTNVKAAFLYIVEVARVRLWWNGTLVIDATLGTPITFTTASVFQTGQVISTSATGTSRPARNYKFNSLAWWTPATATALDATLFTAINTYYAARIGS